MRLTLLPLLLASLLITTTAGTAFADGPPSEASSQPSPEKKKRPTTARNLAIGGALVGPALVGVAAASGAAHNDAAMQVALAASGVAFVLAPSAGHWYAGKTFSTGLVLRLAGAGAAVVGFGIAAPCLPEECFKNEGEIGGTILLAGAALIVAGTVWDLVTADDEARSWNDRHGLDLQLAPTLVSTGRGTAPGLAVVGSF
jgi:hypothetical protein